MAKKNRRKAESAPAAEQVSAQEVTVQEAASAQAAQPKRSARATAISLAEQQRKLRMGIIAGFVLFVVLSLSPHGSIKGMAMAAFVTAIAVLFAKKENFVANLSWPVVFVFLFVLMNSVSTFYALAGKFALSEVLKIMLGLSVFVLILCFETKNTDHTGLPTATAVEVAMAIASFLSIDIVSTRIFSGIIVKLFGPVNSLYLALTGDYSDRIQTLFENPNVFAGCAGLAIMLSLGLLSAAEEKKSRRIHLVCLLVSSIAFILAFSRTAAGMIAIAFIFYLLLERGEKRIKALVVMVETLVFSVIAAVPTMMTALGPWEGVNVLPLLLTVVCTVVFIVVDEHIGVKLSVSMAKYSKAAIALPLVLVATVVVYFVLAMSVTGSVAVAAGENYVRSAPLSAGTYTLSVEADQDMDVTIITKSRNQTIMGQFTELYSGPAQGVTFAVPEDSMLTTFTLSSESDANLERVSYSGTESGELKLDYKLMPAAIEERVVDMFYTSSFQLRIMLFGNGMTLFSRQPLQGLGLGSFENAAPSIQEFHYETKYVHNHFIQCLVDTGIIGLVLFVAVLLSCALAMLLMWRRGKEEMHALTPALFAALLFSVLHAMLELVYSTNFYLVIIFAVFALIVLCCGETLPLRFAATPRHSVWAQRAYAAVLALWIVLLGLNIYAKSTTVYLSYPALVTATNLDRYERNDYMLTYVHNIVTEERTAEQDAHMYDYLERLEEANSNTIPLYLARCYFELGDSAKAFEMLRKFTSYTASDEEKWDAAYRQAAQYYAEDNEAYYNGLLSLVKDMNEWNETHLGEIALEDDIAGFLIYMFDSATQAST